MEKEIVQSLVHVFALILPEVVLVGAACVLFLGGTVRASRHVWATLSLAALGGAGLVLWLVPPSATVTNEDVYAAPIFLDGLAVLVKVIALAGGALLVLCSWDEVPDRQAAEYHACLLVIVAGLCLTGSANDLVTLFLALEMISIPTYVLLYLPRHDLASQEAAMKYFLLSVFSTSFLLFGFSYLYGLTGTTNISGVIDALTQGETDVSRLLVGLGESDAERRGELLRTYASWKPMALVALVMVVAGLGFKITAVPFHFYAPDVYQGAPTVVAAVLAFLPKAAGFVALFRVLGFVWAGRVDRSLPFGEQLPILLWILAAVTMSLGNLLALLQSNVKRLLAYSSVAHAGYMLIGLAVAHGLEVSAAGRGTPVLPGGADAVLFYLIAYGAMTIGAFAVLTYLSTPERPVEMEDDLAGLGSSHPGIALFMAVFLFSLIGMPLTAGFAGKLLLFFGALKAGETAPLFRWLAVVGAVNAAIAGWYYLRILAKMYLHNPIKPLEPARGWPVLLTLWICAALTLVLGIYPDPLVQATSKATAIRTQPPLVSRAER